MPVPKPKSNELIERANKLRKDTTINEFELHRIKHEAEKLVKNSSTAFSGYAVLGMISALLYDKDAVEKNYNAALTLSPAEDRPVIGINHAISLLGMYEFRESLNILVKLLDSYPDDLTILKEAIRSARAACDFYVLDDLLERWAKLHNREEPSSTSLEHVKQFINRAEQLGVTSKEINAVAGVVASIFSGHKLHHHGVRIDLADEDDPFLYSYCTTVDLNKAVVT